MNEKPRVLYHDLFGNVGTTQEELAAVQKFNKRFDRPLITKSDTAQAPQHLQALADQIVAGVLDVVNARTRALEQRLAALESRGQ